MFKFFPTLRRRRAAWLASASYNVFAYPWLAKWDQAA